jgi:hypothetical protein
MVTSQEGQFELGKVIYKEINKRGEVKVTRQNVRGSATTLAKTVRKLVEEQK